MLLIALSLKNPFRPSPEHVPAWYGISADTAGRGLGGLFEHELLTREKRFEDQPLSPAGYSAHYVYELQDPFKPKSASRSKPPPSQ